MSVYDDLILHISPDKFYVESLSATNVVLVIDRINYNISLETNNDQIPAIASRLVAVMWTETSCQNKDLNHLNPSLFFLNFRKPIAGIVGIISLVSGPYLVVITRKAKLGSLLGGHGDLWKIVETEIISYARRVVLDK